MLFIAKYSPYSETERRKLSMPRQGDVVVLLQDAVLFALGDPVIDELKGKGVKVYALKEDFTARGYSEDMAKVELVDYPGFIDLVVEHGEEAAG